MLKNKKIIFATVFSLLLASCGSVQTELNVFIYDANDTFINTLYDNIKKEAKDLYQTKAWYGQKLQSKQNLQINEVLKKGEQTLIVNTVDRLSSSAIIEKAKLNNSEVIFINREPLTSDLKNSTNAYYVGSDSNSTGLLQAEMAKDLFGDPFSLNPIYDKNSDNKIQVVILKGEQGHQDAEKRTKTCIEGLISDGYEVEVLATKAADWSKEEAYFAFKDIYKNYKEDIELVFANNDDMALGVAQFLDDNGQYALQHSKSISAPYPIIGVDGTDVGIQAIEKGYIYGTVLNDAQKQAEIIVKLADYLINNKDLTEFDDYFTNEKFIFIQGQIITKK